ncbi:MAG: DUF429 domain-containing protein [Actinobacteria bacterium]|nr:DUF429 domain-containing protein [Actinomycetota bacterium]
MSAGEFVGIDLGGRLVHAVRLRSGERGKLRIRTAAIIDAGDDETLTAFCETADRVAIDAPSALSRRRHSRDRSLSQKFRVARCCEIAPGQEHKAWAPWVTPSRKSACSSWMVTGFSVWTTLRQAAHEPRETYPHAVFLALGGKMPSKATAAGRRARVAALATRVTLPTGIEHWSHDGLDAMAAAVVAADGDDGVCASHDHPDHDGSAIWLPRPTRVRAS